MFLHLRSSNLQVFHSSGLIKHYSVMGVVLAGVLSYWIAQVREVQVREVPLYTVICNT